MEAAESIKNVAERGERLKGVQFSGVASGIKASGLDLGLVYFEEPTHVAALYTRNKVKAAHILYNRKTVKGAVRALLVNSGCANACTGIEGVRDFGQIAGPLSSELGIEKDEILFASTGVIGRRLPVREDNRRASCTPENTSGKEHRTVCKGHHDYRHLPQACAGRCSR